MSEKKQKRVKQHGIKRKSGKIDWIPLNAKGTKGSNGQLGDPAFAKSIGLTVVTRDVWVDV